MTALNATRSRRLRLRLEFDGALFCGWQLQSEIHEAQKSSVQGEVERALGVYLRSPSRVVIQGCGRTDAGVSAREFYAHFDLPESSPREPDLEKFRHGLNGILPEGIAVLRVDSVPAEFHALRDVARKTYEYTLLLRRAKPTLERSSAYWVPETLATFRIERILEALKLLEGRHDFVAFAASDHTAQTTVREVYEARAEVQALIGHDDPVEGALIYLRFTGEGFLKQMVRTLVGTLVEVGQGKRDLDSIARLLSGDASRSEAGPCAPPHALRLLSVFYGDEGTP
jgi:tRNA pseudouridine38-40 synthase